MLERVLKSKRSPSVVRFHDDEKIVLFTVKKIINMNRRRLKQHFLDVAKIKQQKEKKVGCGGIEPLCVGDAIFTRTDDNTTI